MSKAGHEISPDRYKDPKDVLAVKGLKTKARYLNFYHEYTCNNLSMTQIAEKYKVNITTVRDGIKWLACQEGNLGKEVYRNAMEGRLYKTLQELTDTLDRAKYTFNPKKMNKYFKRMKEFLEDDDVIHTDEVLREAMDYFEKHAHNQVTNEMAVRSEIRHTVKMLAQVEHVLGPDPQKGQQGPVKIEVHVPNLGRGQGVASAIQVEGNEVKAEREIEYAG